ncbi:methyl-accepting chemotaxis protein [Nocardioides sp.]|uniref:methyl-accepting chemotaxis protein n=1 Tax=Nocardioides sp. TaxID=35761 RepID=UPI0035122E83
MKITWSVGRRLTALSGAGALGILVIGGAAWVAVGGIRSDTAVATQISDGRTLMTTLAERATEMRVDVYDTVLVGASREAFTTHEQEAKDLVGQMRQLDLDEHNTTQVETIAGEFDTVASQYDAFLTRAQAQPVAARQELATVGEISDALEQQIAASLDDFAMDRGVSQDAVSGSIDRLRLIVALVGGLCLAALLGLGLIISRSITRPLTSVTRAFGAFARGDLTQQVAEDASAELGDLQRSLNSSLSAVASVVSTVTESTDQVAAAAVQLSASSQQIAAGAEETSVQASVVSNAAEEVSANVQTIYEGSEQMSASIVEISQSAIEASRVAHEAVSVVERTHGEVARVGQSSQEIGNVVQMITSIAEQTNMLALNATIEAARAGEAGRGFAVVANEVKDLAQETAKATDDIVRRVQTIQADSERAVSAMGEVLTIITAISNHQMTIAAAVEEQTATTSEMNRILDAASTGAGEIAHNISGVATATAMTTQAVGANLGAVGALSELAERLRREVSHFGI